jgi:hypothetical protein
MEQRWTNVKAIHTMRTPCGTQVGLFLNNAAHAEYRHRVRKVIVRSIVHTGPSVDGGIVMPWAQLIDDNLTLNNYCFEK